MIDSPRDLYDTIQGMAHNYEETILDCNELLKHMDTDDEFTLRFIEIIKEECEIYSLCPWCGKYLQDKSYTEEHEAYGSPCEEEIHNFVCVNPDCENY